MSAKRAAEDDSARRSEALRFRANRAPLRRLAWKDIIRDDARALAEAESKPSVLTSDMMRYVHDLMLYPELQNELTSTTAIRNDFVVDESNEGPYMYFYEFDAGDGVFVDLDVREGDDISKYRSEFTVDDMQSEVKFGAANVNYVTIVRATGGGEGEVKFKFTKKASDKNALYVMRVTRSYGSRQRRSDGKEEKWTRRMYERIDEEIFYDLQGKRFTCRTVKPFPLFFVYTRRIENDN